MPAPAMLNLFGARTAAALWTPSDLTSGVDWWDWGDESSVTWSSGTASQIDGQQGVHNLAQASGSNQPGYGTRTVNGLYVGDFNGSSTYIQKTGVSIANPLTVWGVVVPDANTSYWSGVGGGGVPVNVGSNGSSVWVTEVWRSASSGSTYTGGAQLVATSLGSGSGSHGNGHMRVDGSVDATSLDLGYTTVTQLRFGCDFGGVFNCFNGALCAHGIAATDIDSTEWALLVEWAQSRWGTP